jgi:uncharacterized protein YpmS
MSYWAWALAIIAAIYIPSVIVVWVCVFYAEEDPDEVDVANHELKKFLEDR